MTANVHHSREMTDVTLLVTIVDIAHDPGTAEIEGETRAGLEIAATVTVTATEEIVMGVGRRIGREAPAETVATNDEVSASYAVNCTACSADD